jgi:hypothetical protein
MKTPITDQTHSYVAQRCIAFCAAYVDKNFDTSKVPMIDTDRLISEACQQFGIESTSKAYQETFEMREGYLDV